ncbi:MAG: acyl--CoA ligase [Alphaproteobacteria bacterium]|nr:acyl--CoA ligase [Alphaproteobacteria bacterium]
MTAPWRGDTLAGHAAARPDAPAIVSPAGTITWAAFRRWIEGTAAALHARGVATGDPVGVLALDTPEQIVASFALWRLGAGVLLLDPLEPEAMRRALLAQIGARHLVGEDTAGIRVERAWAEHATDDLPPPPAPDTICVYRRSSGTTGGVPKLVPSTHRREQDRGQALATLMARRPEDRYLAIMAMAHGFAAGSAQRGLMNGGAVILPPPLRTVDDLVATARRHGATWTAVTPFHLRSLLAAGGPAPLLPGVRLLVSTAVLTVTERAAVMDRISPELYMSYGANEIGGAVGAGPEELRRHPDTVGRACPGVEVEAVDDRGRRLPPGEVGELRLRHPDFPRSYIAPPVAGSSRFKDGWFYPGDLGWIDADGYVFLKGRLDDVINVGGTKVYPVDVEEVLMRHPAVAEAAVIGVGAALRGMVVVAAVVLRAPATTAELVAHCRAALGPDHAPRAILMLDALPRTRADKPDKRALQALAVDRLTRGPRD